MYNVFNKKLPIQIKNKFEYKINYYNIRNKCTYKYIISTYIYIYIYIYKIIFSNMLVMIKK